MAPKSNPAQKSSAANKTKAVQAKTKRKVAATTTDSDFEEDAAPTKKRKPVVITARSPLPSRKSRPEHPGAPDQPADRRTSTEVTAAKAQRAQAIQDVADFIARKKRELAELEVAQDDNEELDEWEPYSMMKRPLILTISRCRMRSARRAKLSRRRQARKKRKKPRSATRLQLPSQRSSNSGRIKRPRRMKDSGQVSDWNRSSFQATSELESCQSGKNRGIQQ
ncbi:hypothetical protein B0H12DRAFT_46515 [Mycena haematopus]|nr:hypothetical protein B0H12DRAFT_46515 [Mycena haematopus]